MADVEVSSILARWERVNPPRLLRSYTHHTTERLKRDVNIRPKLAIFAQHRVMKIRGVKVVCEQSKKWQHSIPSPPFVFEVNNIYH
jgi:hypothetical protein